MDILLVSGFLGAGKTTFIRELIKKTRAEIVVLENEYGENDLDVRSINQTSDLQVLEFMEGCVCCTKKDSFVNTVLAVSAGMDPRFLVVEPSGIGKLGSMIDTLSRICYARIRLLEPLVILCPRTLNSHLLQYPDICEDQIRHAGKIIFSKTEQEDHAVIEEAVNVVRRINPDAEMITTPYREQDKAWWQSLLQNVRTDGGVGQKVSQNAAPSPGSGQERADETAHDILQFTLREGTLMHPASLCLFLEDMLRGAFGEIIRAKGVIRAGKSWLRFDLADELYAVCGEDGENPVTQCFFAGRTIDEIAIRRRLGAGEKAAVKMRPADLQKTG